MKKILIVTIKSWNIENALLLKKKLSNECRVYLITDKGKFNKAAVDKIDPDYIFFPHWSWKIPTNIYTKYDCIAFHMTDLPFGRGGSPLQNLIARGFKKTKISAIKVEEKLDSGPVYLKRNLGLEGTAQEILSRASDIIFKNMIPKLITGKIKSRKQTGKVVVFKRRKLEQSDISRLKNIDEIYDHIRMLDGEGYPNAFIKSRQLKIYFSEAQKKGKEVFAKARIEVNK